MNQPLVSVVIPTYNRGHTIGGAIDSVMQQSLTDLEIIVIDDCSTDNTAAVIHSLSSQQVRYYRNDVNLRGGGSRNKGVTLARGKFIAFLDSDDEWTPEKLALQMELLMKCEKPYSSVCYSKLLVRRGEIEFATMDRGVGEREKVADYLFKQGGHIQTSSLLMSKALLMRCGFDEGLKKHQDWDLVLRLEAIGAHFVWLEKPATIWYQNAHEIRVSDFVDTFGSRAWIERHKNHISKGAFFGFLALIVVPELLKGKFPDRIRGCGLLTCAFLFRAVGAKQFLIGFAKMATPALIIRLIKRLGLL